MADDQVPVGAYEDAAASVVHADKLGGRSVGPAPLDTSPPADVTAEEWLLGAMMKSASAIGAAETAGVVRESFFRPSHRLVWDAIMLARDRGEVDDFAVIRELKAMPVPKGEPDHGKAAHALEAVGGAPAVLTLEHRVPAVAMSHRYAEAVAEAKAKRRLVEVGHEVARLGYDTTIAGDAGADEAQRLLLEVVTSTGAKHERGVAVDGDAAMDAWEAAYHRRSDPELNEKDTVSWGRPELDVRLGRMRPGAVFVPAGWTKHGKTWFVLDVAEAAMEQGHRVLIDSMEMSPEELGDRWMAMGGHNLTSVEEGRLPFSVLHDRRKQMRRWDRRILQGRGTIARLRSQMVRARLEGRPYRVVVLDHLGLLRPDPGQRVSSRREFVEDAVAEFKALMEEHGATGLLVSQLSRPPAEKDAHPRYLRAPVPSDLKEASGIEQIATAVIFVYRRMERETGRFRGQDAVLLFPFHRSKQQPDPLTCEFVLPARPGQSSGSAYRFEPVTVTDAVAEPSEEAQAVQQQLAETFGPVEIVPGAKPDDDIPF